MIVFVDIDGIVDFYCLNFLFTTCNTVNSFFVFFLNNQENNKIYSIKILNMEWKDIL